VTNGAPHLVLFDIDGTLLRGAGPAHKNALLSGIQQVTGRIVSFDGIDTAGQLDRDLIATLLSGPLENERSLSDISLACCQSYSANCPADLSVCVCKGVRAALASLQAHGAVLGLVTGNLADIGWRKMELAGLRSFFSLGAFSEDGHTRADLARIALERAREKNLVDADCRVSLIGDHANDIRAAQANRFRSVAVASGVLSAADLAQWNPDLLLNDLSELDAATFLR
jgi:phosphoglycolate phosphatase